MRSCFKPVHNACFRVLDQVAVPGQWPVGDAPVHDQLHVLDAALEMRMEVSGDGRESDLVLLITILFIVGKVQRVAEYAVGREETVHESRPVGKIILPLWSL